MAGAVVKKNGKHWKAMPRCVVGNPQSDVEEKLSRNRALYLDDLAAVA